MYHSVTRDGRSGDPTSERDGNTPDDAADTSAAGAAGAANSVEGTAAAERDGATRKERVLHTRVPAVLERELKRFAENLRIPVSNLIRTILEDAVDVADMATGSVEERLKSAARTLEQERERLKKRVRIDPLADVFAFQAVTLAQRAACARCGVELSPGTRAHLGLTDGPTDKPRPRVFVCDACLPRG
jgi:hypothetical protein